MVETLIELRRRIAFTLAATIICALVFTWVQALTDTTDIAEFIGAKIVEVGQYQENFASAIGWTTHLAIAFVYALAFTVLISLPLFPRDYPKRILAGLIGALVVGVITTWIANPAISITISVLAGQGWPEKVASIYFKLGVPLWNHIVFFLLTFGIVGGLADVFTSRAERN